MKEILLLSLAVYGLHTFAQNTDRVTVKTAPDKMNSSNVQLSPQTTAWDQTTNMDPNRTNGSMNSNTPPINTPDRINGNLNKNYPMTRAREAARQDMPSHPTSSDRTLQRTN
ncbi:MAG: hypothetical protein H7235_11280 [Bdellovibrionaceae bacterium]|nr:hypothetical protein [Pseudobdellovibrionaceae bacterium]